MVKKRRQGDPYSKESDSSSEENFNAEKNRSDQKCSHVKKAVDLQRLRRQFKKSSIENEKCVECAKLPDSDNPAAGNNEFEYDRTLWMCLNCGTNLCGRSVNKHALLHYNVCHTMHFFFSFDILVDFYYIFFFIETSIRFSCVNTQYYNVNAGCFQQCTQNQIY